MTTARAAATTLGTKHALDPRRAAERERLSAAFVHTNERHVLNAPLLELVEAMLADPHVDREA